MKVLKFVILAALLPLAASAGDVVISMKDTDGKATLTTLHFESGQTEAILYTHGKAAERLFELLSRHPHARNRKNPGLDEWWFGEQIMCLKFLNEKNRVLCNAKAFDPQYLKQ